MKVIFTKPTIYVSHAIRSGGKIKENCEKALAAGRRLKRTFPEVDFYIPAAGDLTLQILSEAGMLDIDSIMLADLAILCASNGYLYYAFATSVGGDEEEEAAIKYGLTEEGIRYKFEYDIEKMSYAKLRKDMGPLIDFTVNNFRSTR